MGPGPGEGVKPESVEHTQGLFPRGALQVGPGPPPLDQRLALGGEGGRTQEQKSGTAV